MARGAGGSKDLFVHALESSTAADPRTTPLAERMRPRSLDDLVGQERIVGPGTALRRAIEGDRLPSLLLWGPPGSGKTTLARLLAQATSARFVPFSAVLQGIPEVKQILGEAREARAYRRQRTLLFVDEIHRFNKAQQDAFLPYVEDGTVRLVGATTENPSFAVNAALLSRCRAVRLDPLSVGALVTLLTRALQDEERGLGALQLEAEDAALLLLAQSAQGDARRALTALETVADDLQQQQARRIDLAAVQRAQAAPGLRHDKKGEDHYGVVSAFIKSMRGSEPHAALYWMARMLEAGEDPLFVARRMLIFASEDIGNADPRALTIALDADAALRRMGMPEGVHPLAQACTYLATAPKSNAAIGGYHAALEDVKRLGALPVPAHLRNASSSVGRQEGYGESYVYPHNEVDGFAAGQHYLPHELEGATYYAPKNAGYEVNISARMDAWAKRRREAMADEDTERPEKS